MHIKKLEICGFKSFVDRTVIHFDEDVIGIVGPNGCGKSNIVDAIRWAMGEQSAKHLRGRSMSDVIFNGSETRGPHGMAEVTLTFDNTDPEAAQTLPLEYRDYAEIAVTRRLFRDGTSEYSINKTQVRLKDVTDLFLGTGVGTKAYSIIEQGKIGLIVSAKAEDRRLLIEEAAGITKYKSRKRQAEQKMEMVRQNLLRVGDIVAEIERNLASLKRQAAKAERYVAYRNELEDLLLHEAAHRFLELVAIDKYEQAARAEQAELERQKRAALDAREAELESLRLDAHAREERAEAAQTAAFGADNEVRACEAEIARARDRLHHLDERLAAAAGEQHELAKSLAELEAERAKLATELEVAEALEAAEASRAIEQHERLEELRAEHAGLDRHVVELRARASEASAAVARAEATLSGYDERLEEMTARRERLEDELGRLRYEAEDVERRRAALIKHVAELAKGKRIGEQERERLEAEMKSLREAAVVADKAVDHAKNELGQARSRLRALEELAARLEGVGDGVKSLLATKDPCLLGLVADRIEASAEVTAALSGLLGERLQWIVTTDMARGVELLADLAKHNRGRATLVPARPPYVAGRAALVPRAEGVLGLLVDRLGFSAEDDGLVRTLVGDAVLVDTVEHACSPALAGRTVVALDGTVVHADGRVSGGSGDAVGAAMLEHKREIRELHEEVSRRSEALSARLAEQQAIRLQMTDVGTALDRARTEAHAGELALVTAEKDLKRTEEQLAANVKRTAAVTSELSELDAALARASGEQAQARTTLEEGRRALDEAKAALGEAEGRAQEALARVAAQQAVVTERKVSLARVRERASAVRATVERLVRSATELSARITRLDEERDECARGAGEAAATMVRGRERLVIAVAAAQEAHEALADARRALDDARNVLSEREVDLKSLRQELTEATERLREHDMTLQRIAIEREHVLGGVRDRFRGLELERIIGDFHKRPPVDETHRARISELGVLLDRMGPVNVDAVREHAEAEERYRFYTEQKADLEKALDDLEKAIAQMNRESKRLFRQTFDGINARFQELFPKMFRGGKAELRLTNPDDLLETGIEILAQPPGKKLGNIELMSGGEKALTAVSLIFAIFQFKPSPFCVLDEVDAPLDEANVARYNEAIRSMTDRSQFILITHIKKTMQSVDVLYGVTMQEAGVSKIVSVRVNEAAEQRSARRQASAESNAAVA